METSSGRSRRDFLKASAAIAALGAVANPTELFAQHDLESKSPARGYAAKSADGILTPWEFERRALREDDVKIEILYCGVCHSDIHQVRGEWGPTPRPHVPGHEIAGRVVQVGRAVTRFKAGDHVGVRFVCDSCGTCESCKTGHEQYCERGQTTFTSGGPDKYLGGITQGGYADYIVTREHFVVKIPASMDLQTAAPLLCAGVTTYSAQLADNVGPGTKIGVAGIGGLGHLAIKIAAARGAEVVAFTTSPSKVDDARRFGAKDVVVVSDAKSLSKYRGSLDVVVSTIPAAYDSTVYLRTVKPEGHYTQIGIPATGTLPVPVFGLAASRVNFNSHFVGGMKETQDILNFCAEHHIAPEVEVIDIESVNEAFNKVVAKNVRYRYVIDMKTLG
jgi:alcohol dehydrogenase (NADP+)